MRLLVCLTLAVAGYSQTIGIEPVAVSRGSANIFRMLMKPRADRPIAALQWEFLYPKSLRMEPGGVVPSGAVQASGKTAYCAVLPQRQSEQVLRCVLAGGGQPLPDGTIVIVRFVAESNAPRGAVNVRLEKIVAVSSSVERTALENVVVPVTIR
jgi:hypothetical protein